jgi:hypothetical protein
MSGEKMRRIELNSFGPFNHGVWENSATGEKIGKEEFLSGTVNLFFLSFVNLWNLTLKIKSPL